jgi:hypothetical protein
MKTSSSGDVLWVRQLGSVTEASSSEVISTSGSDKCFGVAVDNSGNVYCAGKTTYVRRLAPLSQYNFS